MNVFRLLLPAALVFCALPARAETRLFIVASNPDGYGVDRCLGAGAPCGAAMARSYCEARQFADAVSFRRVNRGDITATATTERALACAEGAACADLVAIECER